MPTSELDTHVLWVAVALAEKCPLPVGRLVAAKALPGWLDKSPPVAILLPVVTESPAAVTREITVLQELAGTRPPVVVVGRPEVAGNKSPPGWFRVCTMIPVS